MPLSDSNYLIKLSANFDTVNFCTTQSITQGSWGGVKSCSSLSSGIQLLDNSQMRVPSTHSPSHPPVLWGPGK